MNNKYHVLLKDTLIFGLGSIGSKVILFLLVPLYTNYMSESEYGIADLVFTVSQLIVPFVSLVIFDSVIRFGLSKYEKRENVLLVGLLVGLAASVVTICMTPALALYSALSKWRWYLAIYVIVSVFYSIVLNYLKAKDLNQLFAILSVLQTVILAGLNIYYLVLKHKGIEGYLLSTIISTLIIVLIGFYKGQLLDDLKHATYQAALAKEMIVYSSPLIFNNISWWVIHSSDKIMVEAMVSATALGIYTVASKIPSIINVGVSVFQQAWGISVVKEIENDNDVKYYSTVFEYLFVFTSILCVLIVSITKMFMHYYVGNAFESAWKYVPYLLNSAVFGAIAAYYGSLYGALKKSVNNMLSTLFAAFLNLVLNFILIHYWGVFGAVISTLVSYGSLALFRMLDVNRFIRVQIRGVSLSIAIILMLFQSTMVTLDFHIYSISLAVLIALVLLYKNQLLRIIAMLNNKTDK